jgi:hypothetical protein
MPVTGEISELPLPELLNMMRHRSGKLSLFQTQQVTEMQLHFTPGYLCGFMVDKYVIKSESQVVDKLVSVTAAPIGHFCFTPAHASSLMGSVRLGIDRLALIIVSQVDEISVNKQFLPAPHRIFRLQKPDEKVQFEEQNLAEFFRNSVNLLKCGISAEKLASIEQISPEQVQLYLYKLNLLGLVAPTRRDDLWAQLDSVLQPKSTPLRLNNAESAHDPLQRRVTARIWSPNRTATGAHVTNKQRAVANLLVRKTPSGPGPGQNGPSNQSA